MNFSWYFLAILLLYLVESDAGTFSVDYQNQQFLKDGKPFRYISGSIHYFRVHPGLWNDRLKRVRAAGLNAIQTYIPWNLHEPFEGKFDFSDGLNLTRFLDLAQQNDLYVLLRAGPFIAAEWEFGGLPWWLIKYRNLTGNDLRSSNPIYLNAVQNFYTTFLPIIKNYLYQNGGPILMIQIENEYGNPRCDHNYTNALRDQFRQVLGSDTVLYTTDQPNDHALGCGHVPDTYAEVDFSPVASENFSQIDTHFGFQQKHNGGGPKACSEFYPGWFVNWGDQTPHPRPFSFVGNLAYMYAQNASFNIYMFHGGTNFGFQNGAGGSDLSVITSYDYWAPISENGAITSLYQEIRSWIGTLPNWHTSPLALPENNTASNYGKVVLQRIGTNLISTLTLIQEACHQSTDPMSFEDINHAYGFVLYTTTLISGGKTLLAPNLRDYAYVFVNNNFQGMMINTIDGFHNKSIILSNAQAGDTLRILVENRSRWTWGTYLDTKGLHSNATLDNFPLQNWFTCGINLTKASIDSLVASSKNDENLEKSGEAATSSPGVFYGEFDADVIQDTFFDSTGWSKGQLFINGYNLGRYWPVMGPQITLYVPSPYIQQKNTVLLIELIGTQQSYANFIDHSIFDWKNATF